MIGFEFSSSGTIRAVFPILFLAIILSVGSCVSTEWNTRTQSSSPLETVDSSAQALTDDILVARRANSEDFFQEIGCEGAFDGSKFARLERLCEECYQMYRLPDLFSKCRQDCFSNEVFPRCIEALMVTDEKNKLHQMIHTLKHGTRAARAAH
ncbi:ion transport peptide [Brevipalpus obovatus]|uniref:ion transport peptide n=1 Tax=Brevipalpus obovatus TaxID=246614 RepID=UPI003D9EC961